MPGRLWAHDGVRRDRVAERVAEREVAAERSILGREHDCRAVLGEVVVQGVRVIAADQMAMPRPRSSVSPKSITGVRTANGMGLVSKTTAPGGLWAAAFRPTTSV